ncbi:hypothetical protein DPSP01_007440 [Paraphaeosphaeria sporulosa]
MVASNTYEDCPVMPIITKLPNGQSFMVFEYARMSTKDRASTHTRSTKSFPSTRRMRTRSHGTSSWPVSALNRTAVLMQSGHLWMALTLL